MVCQFWPKNIRCVTNPFSTTRIIEIVCYCYAQNNLPSLPNNILSGRKYTIKISSFYHLCCCQVVWQIRTLGIKIFLFHISINLFQSWHTIVKNKLMRISLFFMNVCQLRNKFMLMWNKNIFIWFVHFCQTTWQQQYKTVFCLEWSSGPCGFEEVVY